MNHVYRKVGYSCLIAALLSACAKPEFSDYAVDKPESILLQEELDSYEPLLSYLNKSVNPNFKFGLAVNLDDYINKGVMYRLANRNFAEMVIGYQMKHSSIVQNDGSLDLDKVEKLIALAKQNNMGLYGHTLCWHSGQNAAYLNSLIAPDIIPGSGPALGGNEFSNSNFEAGIDSWFGWGNNSTRELSADGAGYGNKGKALKVTNPSAVNFWEAQLATDFNPPLLVGGKYILKLKIKGSKEGSLRAGFQSPDEGYASRGDFPNIPITTSWEEVTVTTNVTGANAKRFLISFGDYDGTFYIDDISVQWENPKAGGIEKTPAQKEQILSKALETFIAGMLGATKDYVKAWDVVNEPMSDWPDNYALKTGVGKAKLADDEFYWQDYLGKDYAVKAITLARKYGNADDKLFINDYGLEAGGDKCKGLIAYVNYVESKGAKVDGIGTQMHIDITNNKEDIVKMFKLLAATGKLIKVSELDIGMGKGLLTPNATPQQYAAQAEMYKFVIDKYFELIPKAQQYGITIWSPIDSPNSQYSFWRKGEPIGLWTEAFTRKPAFKAVAEALKNYK